MARKVKTVKMTREQVLEQQIKALQAAHRDVSEDLSLTKQEGAMDAETISTLRRDLAEARRQLALCQERARNLHVTSLTLSRLVGEGIAQSEDLRYPVHNQARPE